MRLVVAAALVGAAFVMALAFGACGSDDAPLSGTLGLVSGRGGRVAIWTMHPDGSGAQRLLEAIQPAWSPQGYLAYVKKTDDGNLDLFSLIDGVTRRLTTSPANDFTPAWSPDGKWIAFSSDPEKNADIYLAPATGGELVRLTAFAELDTTPAWSPDGTKIAFVSRRDNDHEIYVMNSDGSAQTRLTFATERDDNPAWSADGEKIAFDSFRTAESQIWVMNTDGSDQEQVTHGDDPAYGPFWSPDGKWIAFNVTAGNLEQPGSSNEDIWVIRTDGSDEKRITDDPSPDTVHGWLPEGSLP